MKFASPGRRSPRNAELEFLNEQPEASPWKEEDEALVIVKPKYRKHRQYKFCVMAGNYPKTLIDTLKARGNW